MSDQATRCRSMGIDAVWLTRPNDMTAEDKQGMETIRYALFITYTNVCCDLKFVYIVHLLGMYSYDIDTKHS